MVSGEDVDFAFVFDLVFFFNDTATTEIYTLSLHDALPISPTSIPASPRTGSTPRPAASARAASGRGRSEEHTSELQSRLHLVCRLLLEKKKNTGNRPFSSTKKKKNHE